MQGSNNRFINTASLIISKISHLDIVHRARRDEASSTIV